MKQKFPSSQPALILRVGAALAFASGVFALGSADSKGEVTRKFLHLLGQD